MMTDPPVSPEGARSTPSNEGEPVAVSSDPSLRLSQIRVRCDTCGHWNVQHGPSGRCAASAWLPSEDGPCQCERFVSEAVDLVSDLIRREQALREQCDELDQYSEGFEESVGELRAYVEQSALRAKAAEDRADALRAYVQHKPECDVVKCWATSPELPCSCGLVDLL